MSMAGTDLPYAAEAETSLGYDELEVGGKSANDTLYELYTLLMRTLQVLRNQYYKEIESGHVTTQSKFNYGALGSDPRRDGMRGALRLRGSKDQRRLDCSHDLSALV